MPPRGSISPTVNLILCLASDHSKSPYDIKLWLHSLGYKHLTKEYISDAIRTGKRRKDPRVVNRPHYKAGRRIGYGRIRKDEADKRRDRGVQGVLAFDRPNDRRVHGGCPEDGTSGPSAGED